MSRMKWFYFSNKSNFSHYLFDFLEFLFPEDPIEKIFALVVCPFSVL